MLSEKTDEKLKHRLRTVLSRARLETDLLFQILKDGALYERPIAERHRIVFYLGHLEAFDWNMIAQHAFGMRSFHPSFDKLFAFGIDPVHGELPHDAADDWPSIQEIVAYNSRVRQSVDHLLDTAEFSSLNPVLDRGLIFHVAIEHRLMHAETLAYMFNFLPYEFKVPAPVAVRDSHSFVRNRQVEIPNGLATLGLKRAAESPFGWDNEFEEQIVDVPAFSIDAYNVTNRDFLRFINEGGYQQPSLWTPAAWEWISTNSITHPKFWVSRGGRFFFRSMFSEVPQPPDWPVYVSYAEASAYARWVGKELPTEAQYHRAAFGTPDGERCYPWGNDAPRAEHGNFDFRQWTPVPVGSFPRGDSAFGVSDLMGNGWEWTSTVFHPFPGFEPFPFYPGYSADFFGGNHFVLKGASPRTSSVLLRRSFRNWFQPYYPNIYAAFRCVEN
jgi:ergothioneine biosynthesis protein EgtB